MTNHIVYICKECGEEDDKVVTSDESCLWHYADCDICGDFGSLTNKRNFKEAI